MENQIQVATIPQRIREAMDIAGKKQIDLVRETGINRSAISRYLSGEYEPKQVAIFKLARALDVSEVWLMGYDVPMERTYQKKNDTLTDIILRMRKDDNFFSLIETLYDFDDDKISVIKQMLSTLLK